VWRKDQELFEMQDSRRSPESGYSNGKGKEKQSFDEGDEEDDDDDDDTVENHGGGSHEAYPPTTDAVAETRRVEEVCMSFAVIQHVPFTNLFLPFFLLAFALGLYIETLAMNSHPFLPVADARTLGARRTATPEISPRGFTT
jgi:hypothetical protein